MEVNVGEKAPLFTLRAHDKSAVSLESYTGRKVVLVFFPLAFSSVCTTELCSIRDNLEQYNDLNAEVLAISTDSLYTLRKFREIHDFNFLLLSDYNKEVSRCYGALHEDYNLDMKGVTKRAVFVIDSKGVVKHKEILEDPSKLPNFDRVKEILASLAIKL